MRKPALAFLLVSLSLALFAAPEREGQSLSLADWKWKAEDQMAFAEPDYDDSAWDSLALPGVVDPGSLGSVFWLRARVEPARLAALLEEEEGRGLYFLSDKAGVAFELYMNGVYVGSRGTLPPVFRLRSTQATALHIPAALFEGEVVVLALRGGYAGSAPRIPLYSLAGERSAEFVFGAVNFWNGRIYLLLSTLSAFLGLYSFLLYLFRRIERDNLFYALTLFCIALYFYEMGAEHLPFSGAWFRALSRSGIVLSMAFMVPFMSSFFGFSERRRILVIPLGVALAFTATYLLVSRDASLISLVFTLSLLPITASILFGLVLAVRARKAGNPEALLIIVGIGLGLGLSAHDIFYQALGKEPFAWLQGPAFFILNMAVFVALSARQSRLKSELERYAKEAESSARAIEDSLARLEAAGEAARVIGRELEASAIQVADSVEDASSATGRIAAEAESQAAASAEAELLVQDFVSSLERVNERLAEQAASVEQTAAASAELSAGAASVADNIGSTAEFAASLAELTGEGEAAAAALGGAVAGIAEASRGIGEILDALNDFAERTGLLAMNAAIEAAHAGQAGRGFAIIAGEVKGLAQAQTLRAGKIREIVGEIGQRVEVGARDAERVGSSLREIARRAAEAAARIAEARAGTEEQERSSLDIRRAMEALAEAGSAIRNEAQRQTEGSTKVAAALAAMSRGAFSTREAVSSIARESAEIVASMRRLRELAEKSLEIVDTKGFSSYKLVPKLSANLEVPESNPEKSRPLQA